MDVHNYERIVGSSTGYECLDCGAVTHTANGAHPSTLRPREWQAPFNPCSPDRETIFENFRIAREVMKRAVILIA
jgi:hypothetical protein